jgi:Tol biopolymer transport system component
MTTRALPVTDAELAAALTPTAVLSVPSGLVARIDAEIDLTDQRPTSWLRLPAILAPRYPDQRGAIGVALAVVLLSLMLLAAAVVASRLLSPSLPHGNGPADIFYRGGYIEVQPDGSPVVLRSFPGVEGGSAAWSPTGDRVAVWGGANRTFRLLIADAEWRVLTSVDVQARLGVATPVVPVSGFLSWSADGTIVVFDGSVRGLSHIYRYDVLTDRLADISPAGIAGAWPALSPDGRRVAFIPDDQVVAGRRPWIMMSDGTDAHPLVTELPDETIAGSGYTAMAWSHDGRQILFDAQRGGQFRLFVVNGDGTGLVRLAPELPSTFAGLWSPDDRQILFSNYVRPTENRDFDIWVVDRDGSQPERVMADADSLGFSPDGRSILVSTPSCDSDRRRTNQCDPAIWSIDRATGTHREVVSKETLDSLGDLDHRDDHGGLGWTTWRPVYP